MVVNHNTIITDYLLVVHIKRLQCAAEFSFFVFSGLGNHDAITVPEQKKVEKVARIIDTTW
jgi:hypothetical protein